MDFDDELLSNLQTPDPPTQSTTPTPTTTTTNTTNGKKVGELFYIRPIPEGLSAPTLDNLLTLCHAHTLTHGFDVVKKAGCKPTQTIAGKKRVVPGATYYKWHIPCVLAGKTKNTRHMSEDQRVREKRTMKQGCPSRVWAWARVRDRPEGAWEIRYGEIDPALHNHPPVDVRGLPNHRRRAREAEGVAEAIGALVSQGLGRREGLEQLRQKFPDAMVSEKDYANEMQKYRLQQKEQMVAQRNQGEENRDPQQQQQVQQEQQARRQSRGLVHEQRTGQRHIRSTDTDGYLPDASYW